MKLGTTGRLLVAALFSIAGYGCESGCDGEVIDEAVAFLKNNQACQTDDDCVIVGDFCEALPGGFCGQLVVNRTGAESDRWASFERELSDCAPNQCSVCTAARILTCDAGSCGGP